MKAKPPTLSLAATRKALPPLPATPRLTTPITARPWWYSPTLLSSYWSPTWANSPTWKQASDEKAEALRKMPDSPTLGQRRTVRFDAVPKFIELWDDSDDSDYVSPEQSPLADAHWPSMASTSRGTYVPLTVLRYKDLDSSSTGLLRKAADLKGRLVGLCKSQSKTFTKLHEQASTSKEMRRKEELKRSIRLAEPGESRASWI